MTSKQQEEILGYVERITFQNDDNGYTVAQLKQHRKTDTTCIVGPMPALHPGETIRCKGEWKTHLFYGKQFEVETYQAETPADLDGIQKYLGSGLIKGIGPAYAKRITAKFGIDTLNVIDQFPDRLHDVPGIGEKRVEKIKTCWVEQKSIRDLMIFLQSYTISPSLAQKIFKAYGSQSIAKIKENPFCLASDIMGIGFKTADAIAQKMGVPKDAPQRIASGILFVLSEFSSDGHVCYPLDDLALAAQETLGASIETIKECLKTLQNEKLVVLNDFMYENRMKTFVWLRSFFLAELGIARELKRLQQAPCSLRKVDMHKALSWVQEKLKMELAKNQQAAVVASMEEKAHIITGGPGTGKSTITNAILTLTEVISPKILLAAPTGRAAKRMSEITGKKASTIHSLLQFDFKQGGFKHNRQNPLECDLIIIDEASMIDTVLMYHLLKAIPCHARIIFVGDINQLPSVGPGNVLRDLIASKKIPVTMLTEIFRQAAGSRIITNAHAINRGKFPDIQSESHHDFFFMEALEPETVLQTIISLVSSRLPRKYGFDPLEDIQVLAPMRKGMIGIDHLNQILQQTLNTRQDPLFKAGRKFLQGDKVMQTRNNYKKEVFNGDVGKIKEIDLVEQQVIVDFDQKSVEYDFADLDELVLAYAVSVHKYQGSECPCVVIPVHTTHFMMLHRNLLYTGVTRGKKIVVLVGTKKALAIAVNNDHISQRYTALKPALVGMLDE